jgi:hypothetical protein
MLKSLVDRSRKWVSAELTLLGVNQPFLPMKTRSCSIFRSLLQIGLGSVLLSFTATATLPIPTRPTSFPLQRPQVQGKVVAWGNSYQGQCAVPAGLSGVVQLV